MPLYRTKNQKLISKKIKTKIIFNFIIHREKKAFVPHEFLSLITEQITPTPSSSGSSLPVYWFDFWVMQYRCRAYVTCYPRTSEVCHFLSKLLWSVKRCPKIWTKHELFSTNLLPYLLHMVWRVLLRGLISKFLVYDQSLSPRLQVQRLTSCQLVQYLGKFDEKMFTNATHLMSTSINI